MFYIPQTILELKQKDMQECLCTVAHYTWHLPHLPNCY